MRVLIACEDLRVGGAQVFAMRLAQSLMAYCEVYLYSHHSTLIDKGLLNKISPSIKVISIDLPFNWWILKIDRLCYKLNIDYSFREVLITRHIKHVVRNLSIDLVHSNMFKSDYVFAKALKNSNVPFLITMHGNYESYLHNSVTREGEVIFHYKKKLLKILSRVNKIVYLTENNLEIFKKEGFLDESSHKHIIKKKIYNGFSVIEDKPHYRQELNIPQEACVFGFIARGIPAKGWEIALEAFVLLKNKNAHLILVGSSSYVDGLRKKYKAYSNIHFVGYSDNPINWIKIIDVGLLPSFYVESLPNVISECLYCGKPLIVTDNAESALMLKSKEGNAGFVIPLDEKSLVVSKLAYYMNIYIEDKILLERHKEFARQAFKKFDMNHCLNQYLELYKS